MAMKGLKVKGKKKDGMNAGDVDPMLLHNYFKSRKASGRSVRHGK